MPSMRVPLRFAMAKRTPYQPKMLANAAPTLRARGRSDRWIKVKNRHHPAFARVLDQF